MNINDYIASGILDLYVLGACTNEEAGEVERMADIHPEVKKEILEIENAFEKQAVNNAVDPPANVKPLLMATLDYISRLEQGEVPAFPPMLNENSTLQDFDQWLQRPDMVAPGKFDEIYAKIIGNTPEMVSAIVWIKHMSPTEVHHDEYEKFLIVEGTCDIIIGKEVHKLVPGNFLPIPLHVHHEVKVTSEIPCKVILQRIAA